MDWAIAAAIPYSATEAAPEVAALLWAAAGRAAAVAIASVAAIYPAQAAETGTRSAAVPEAMTDRGRVAAAAAALPALGLAAAEEA